MTLHHPRLAILTLLVTVLPATPLLAQTGDGAPSLAVDEPILDVGEVPVGEEIEAEFILRNDGTEPLEITEVKPACGCTVAEYDEEIAPGETGRIRAMVDTADIVGPNAKAITVYTNDPATPRLQLTIKSEVKPFLLVDPGYARFTSLVHGDRDRHSTQVLWAEDFEDLEIEEVESPKPWIEASFRPATAAERRDEVEGRQWAVELRVDKQAPPGPIADHVVVTTNHPTQAEVQIPISGFVRPMVAVTPPDLRFGEVDPAEEQSWGLLVRNFGSSPLEIDGYETSVPGMEVDIEPIEPGRQYKVTLTPTSSMAEGPFEGEVELETNLPQHKTIQIRMSGSVVLASVEG